MTTGMAAMPDDDFEPRLGKIRAKTGGRAPRYLGQVLKAVGLAGGIRGRGTSGFQGNRIGRGAGVGRVLRARDRYAAYRSRRVVIKTRIVKLAGKGLQGAARHLSYLQRDGVTREGEPGALYEAASDRADGKTFLERGDGDRHQFRIIVSAEDAAEYEELKTFTRRLMQQMEADLDTRLDWVAVDHFNTGHPHTHIVVRGKDEDGKDLVIARDYVKFGVRERAAEIVSLDLGPKTDLAVESQLKREVEQERFTSIDRTLLRDRNQDGLVLASTGTNQALSQTLRAGRLQKLKRLDLADEVRPDIWRLQDELEPTLRRMGERGDIIRTLQRAMSGQTRSPRDYAIIDPNDPDQKTIVGRVMDRGLADELHDRHYLVIDGIDGRTHYAEIGVARPGDDTPVGAIVQLRPRSGDARPVDRTITEIAAAYGGRYSAEIHREHDPAASRAFVEAHVRRLEALRRANAGVMREADGSWTIAPDHGARAAAFERAQSRQSPMRVVVLSAWPIEQQIAAEGPTWLDRQLVDKQALRDVGFGREVHEALSRRRQWLIAQTLAEGDGEGFQPKPNMPAILQQRELRRAGAQLSGELGLAYANAPERGTVSGVYRQSVQLASGKFAVIAKSREFSLVPWRPALEDKLGKPVSGLIRGSGISWTVGRQRSGPSV